MISSFIIAMMHMIFSFTRLLAYQMFKCVPGFVSLRVRIVTVRSPRVVSAKRLVLFTIRNVEVLIFVENQLVSYFERENLSYSTL